MHKMMIVKAAVVVAGFAMSGAPGAFVVELVATS